LNLAEDSHRRRNPLTNDWVLVSPHRTARPWLGEVAQLKTDPQPPYDPQCYLCPGNERAGGIRNPAYSETFVFENDFAALKLRMDRDRFDKDRFDLDNRGLIVAEPESGICRVLCFSPRHDLTLATMTIRQIEIVVRAWMEQFRELGTIGAIRHVQIFENRGAMMGASNPHPHGQIWATSSLPQEPSKELAAQRAYFESHRACLLCDYQKLEEREQQRMVWQNEDFLAVVPFWAVWPFETLLCSRRHLATMNEFSDREVRSLAAILQQITSAYNQVFNVPFPYSMGFHQAPTDGGDHAEWHFHAHFYPPLLRSATIRKFMVGFEMLGTPQRDITAESAAARLREIANRS
jgi:UDPglucose--hexose-1-phosphate uridylyltransferase